MIVVQSGDLFEQFDIEVRVNDLDDNEIEIIDKHLRYRIREDEQPGWSAQIFNGWFIFFW